MDEEIDRLLSEENIESEKIDITNNSHCKKRKVIIALLTVVLFFACAITGLKLQNEYGIKDSNKATTEGSSITEISSSFENLYSVNSFSVILNDGNTYKRCLIGIEKETLKQLSETKLYEFFAEICNENTANYITVSFNDNTGFVLCGNCFSLFYYGHLDENGLIDELYGSILKSSENTFSYYSYKNLTNISDNTTAKSADEENTTLKVYITSSGKKYHYESCAYLNKSKIEISLSDAKSKGYLPCSKCVK